MLNREQREQMIKVISECYVRPKHEVEAAKETYHLSPLELIMLSIHPIQKGLLYTLPEPPPSSSSLSHILDKLRSALAAALVRFYPLAGRFTTEKLQDEGKCMVFVDCKKGPGARLIHANAANVSVRDIICWDYSREIVHSLFDLGEKFVNYDCHTRPILSIQVTELVDGVFIGFTMSHCVVDGTSFLQFVTVLSEIFRSGERALDMETSPAPVFNYKPWSDSGSEDEHVDAIKLPFLEIEEFIKRDFPGELREKIFHFSSVSLARLKAKTNQQFERLKGSQSLTISSFQALAALVWRSITKARCLSSDQETTCALLVNARTRLDPPIDDCYFGNYVSQAKASCRVGDLLSRDLGWAAKLINESIMAQDSNAICSLLKWVADLLTSKPDLSSREEIHGSNSVVIGGSARFNMYGAEFGLGRAVAVRMGFANKVDGKVTANPGCEGGGSVDLEICLGPKNMAALEADDEFMSFASSG